MTPPVRHVLSDALSVILPDSDDTLLLRACLEAEESGRQACEAWSAHHDPTIDLARETVKSFLPLLFRAVTAHSVEVDNTFLTILKTASLREELRTRTYRVIGRRVLSALADSECSTIPIRGVVLGETVYPDVALRHSHDIEILVEGGNLEEVARSLVAVGFTPSGTMSGRGRIRLVHSSGLPLVLHRELFQIPFYNVGHQEIRARTQTAVILDTRLRILSPADTLLHICGHAAHSASRDSYRWVADAWFVIDRRRDLDWESLLNAAGQAQLALPLSVTLRYLAEQLNSPVPLDFLDRLAVTASRTRPLGRELALFDARKSARGGFRRLFREAKNWRGRLYVVKWMLAPSPVYLSWVSGLRHSWLLPAQYLCRPVRYLSRRARLALWRDVRGLGRHRRDPLRSRAAQQQR